MTKEKTATKEKKKKVSDEFKLVIVESPTKARTISQFLGKEYKIESSYGHIRDLPKSKIGIDTANNFQPTYVIPTKARKRVNELKKDAEKASEVILASDEDREGEAIAWHLTQALNLDPKNTKRIVFHEITKTAIEEAIKNPRHIDLKLVDAQQARRVLDRLVGYELSPFLWKKIFKGLSAGRVQSVALRLVVDREREIQAFKPEEYWTLEAMLKKQGSKKSGEFEAKLFKKDGETLDKFAVKNENEAEKILNDLDKAEYKIVKIEKKESNKTPAAPFTTSTLQQDAWGRLRFSAKQTMMVAQQLYEQGFITYMRTDSVNLSQDSLSSAHKFITDTFGKNYTLSEPRRFKSKSKNAQEAHEAIRPTDPFKTPELLGKKLDPKQAKLYDLIWRRFIACQMKNVIVDSTSCDIKAGNFIFRATGSTLKFDGWLKIYPAKFTENELPELKEGEILNLVSLTPNQHFTEPPARYTEASLVKVLEEYGIGRPSTYAPTITTIQTRLYIQKNDQRRFEPTETGITVNDILVEHFPVIVDYEFTAKMEEEFDEIAEGKREWVPMIREFYTPFHKNLENKYSEVEKKNTDEATDEKCEKCGKPMIIKTGRFGKFLACTGFPECKTTKTIKKEPETIGMKCPKCKDGDVIRKFTRKRKMFFGCSKYPDCDFASWKKPDGAPEE